MKKTLVAFMAVAAISLSLAQQAQAALATFGGVVSRAPTAPELANDPTLAGRTIHNFFVTTDSDILSVNQVNIDAALYQNGFGTDTEPPNPAFVAVFAGAGADSWISTPGTTAIAGAGGMTVPNSTWFDSTNQGPQANFNFAQLTTSDADWTFTGRVSLAVPGGDPVPFEFAFAGIPEPSTFVMGGLALVGMIGLRRRSKKA